MDDSMEKANGNENDIEQITSLISSIPSEEKSRVLAMASAFIAGMEAQRTINGSDKSA